MSNPHQLPPPASAKPNRRFFDSWNSSSTGHQRADTSPAGSTSWRESRSLKFSDQFGGGASGGARLADTVGADSEDLGEDGRLENGSWAKGAPGLRGRGQISVVEAFGVKKLGVEDTATKKAKAKVMVDGVATDLTSSPTREMLNRILRFVNVKLEHIEQPVLAHQVRVTHTEHGGECIITALLHHPTLGICATGPAIDDGITEGTCSNLKG